VMTVAELIEMLEDVNPEAAVRLADQPGCPLAMQLHGVVPEDEDAVTDAVVWLVAGQATENFLSDKVWAIADVALVHPEFR
jgi:hypothetical protein